MDERNLDDALREAGRRTGGLLPPRALTPPGCVSFFRARLLTLDPDRCSPAERAHLASCSRCSRVLADFEREMPHLSLWTLVRLLTGTLPEEDETLVAYHLESGGCRVCRDRLRRLEVHGDRLVRYSGAVYLPNPDAAAAAVSMPGALARASSGRLEAELFEDGGEVLLEIRTKDASLRSHAVGYSLRGAGAEARTEGYVVLQEDVDGWYTAQVAFHPASLRQEIGGACEELLVAPVDADLLSTEEREALLRSAARCPREDSRRDGWRAWAEETVRGGETQGLSPQTRELVSAVRERLQP